MTVHEEIIKQLGELENKCADGPNYKLSYTMKRWEFELVAEFILRDRKRIIAPLLEIKKRTISFSDIWKSSKTGRAIDETLKNAGITEDSK